MSTLALSSALGWSSIACWIVVYSPQIIENFFLKSGEGLSVAFIVRACASLFWLLPRLSRPCYGSSLTCSPSLSSVWLIGDLTNFIGGAMVGLIPSLVLLAVWYTGEPHTSTCPSAGDPS